MADPASPQAFTDPDAIAQAIVERVGRKIVIALPLGLGKPCHIANALYRRALADPSLHLTLFTALTLEPPVLHTALERRFLAPVVARTMGGYPRLLYAEAQKAGVLPPNVVVNEFFFQAGTRLHVASAQQSYVSANYTHAVRYLLAAGANVVGQLVARRGDRLSLACNTDVSADLFRLRAQGDIGFLAVGEVSDALPFMGGDAELDTADFDLLLASPALQFPLFAPPNEPVEDAHHAIGLHVAALVPDGGSLQLGIGSTSDAVVQGLMLRHRNNAAFRIALERVRTGEPPRADLAPDPAPFAAGLYAPTEMFVNGFLHLYRAGILKREVKGAVLHAGFFLGPRAFYEALRTLPAADLDRLRMTAIAFTNSAYASEPWGGADAKARARVGGRFVNSAMMATLQGDVVSDGLADGRVVSGVGGQFDFVTQAFALPDARSVIALNAWRRSANGRAESNIRFAYGHTTIPRHLRDVVVTEYGVADLRGLPDREVIVRMLNVADSRFQPALRQEAVKAGKLEAGYAIPAAFADNTPARIARALKPAKAAGLLQPFPLGTDFDALELSLLPAMSALRSAQRAPLRLARLAWSGMTGAAAPGEAEKLERLGLAAPRTAGEAALALVVRGAVRRAFRAPA